MGTRRLVKISFDRVPGGFSPNGNRRKTFLPVAEKCCSPNRSRPNHRIQWQPVIGRTAIDRNKIFINRWRSLQRYVS